MPIMAVSQIEVSESTLPDIGDILEYNYFNFDGDTTSYREVGGNLSWSYDIRSIDSSRTEAYLDISGSPLADSFPQANMILDELGSQAAAIRTQNTIEIVGFAGGPLGFLGGGVTRFSDPFVYRTVPINFGDQFSDNISFSFQVSSEFIPGLDSLTLPIPGATLDSIRVTITLTRSESAEGWGSLTLNSETYDVLKIKQEDGVQNKIEFGVSFGGSIIWLDATQFIGDAFGGDDLTTTYKFLSADDKASVLEIEERRVPIDTMGNTMLVTTGRTGQDIVTSVRDNSTDLGEFTIVTNPVGDELSISFENEKLSGSTYLIVDANGIICQRGPMSQKIDVSGLVAGTYFIYVAGEQISNSKPFQKF